jgi:uncharacterized membrane protein YcjF (UPF0283 family)
MLTFVLRTTRKSPVRHEKVPALQPDDSLAYLDALDAIDIDKVIEQWQIEDALERAFLEGERFSVARRIVGFFAALVAFVVGVIATVWVFDNVGLALGLLSAYSLPLFVLLVMLGVERTVPLGKN